ncbi:deoxyribonuclease [Clostridia bacterium]|nr:deoxyribonuclease [Clostridia bacterium]
MKIFDTHTHYDDEVYGTDSERHEFLSSLLEKSVAGFIAIGCSPQRNSAALKIAGSFENAFCAVGIHPLDVESVRDTPGYIKTLEEQAVNSPKVRAIGEIGFDYHYKGYDKDLQRRVFTEQLELALKLNLPVIIHCREAFSDGLPILKDFAGRGLRAVVHCFSEDADAVREYLSFGFYISFTGVVTFKSAHGAREALSAVPIERLMLETDCPYMAPEPYRGKVCDSGMLSHIAQKFAHVKGVTDDEIVTASNANAKLFFGIDF